MAEPTASLPRAPRKLTVLALLLPVLASLAVFWPVTRFGFLNWDDLTYIAQNPLVDPRVPWPDDGWWTPALGYPIPVTVGVYRGLAWLAGVTPAAFHTLNLLLHLANAALFGGLLVRLEAGILAPPLAVLWAIHPLVVEPVAWCTGTKDLLYALTVLLTLHAALRPRLSPLLLAVMLAGMLAKPTAILLPVLLLWTVLAREGKTGWTRPGLRPLVLVGLLLSGAVLVAGWQLAALALAGEYRTVDTELTGIVPRLQGMLQVLDLAVRHVVWPQDLVAQYFRLLQPSWTDAPVLRGLVLALLGLGASLLSLRHRDHRLRLWAGLTLLTWAPVSGLVPLQRFTCDSYLYVPLLCALGWLGTALQLAVPPRAHRFVVWPAVVALGLVTTQQVPQWQRTDGLWAAALRVYPDEPILITRYAAALEYAEKPQAAWQWLEPKVPILLERRAVDAMALAVAAKAAPEPQTRALFAATYANQPELPLDVHRNFCTFVATHPLQWTDAERQNLTRAIVELSTKHVRDREPAALLALGQLAGQNQLWTLAGRLLQATYAMTHNPQHRDLALAAWSQVAGDPEARAAMRQLQGR